MIILFFPFSVYIQPFDFDFVCSFCVIGGRFSKPAFCENGTTRLTVQAVNSMQGRHVFSAIYDVIQRHDASIFFPLFADVRRCRRVSPCHPLVLNPLGWDVLLHPSESCG